jgi:putative heme-binding domain-containing protein
MALVAIDAKVNLHLASRLLEEGSETVSLREKAAQALAGVRSPEAQAALLRCLPTAPARLQSAIAVRLTATREGGEQLLAAVEAGKASARLVQNPPVQVRMAATKVPDLQKRLAKLTQGLPPPEAQLQALVERRRAGYAAARTDPVQGAVVFEKNCANCHQLANKGSKVGPQLDGIGLRGVDRLLEDLLDPNQNVDQAFRSSTLLLTNGQVVSGLVLREEGEVVVLADAQGKEVRVSKSTIEKQAISPLSPMPANLNDQIAEAELYHLLAYLLSQSAPPGGKD